MARCKECGGPLHGRAIHLYDTPAGPVHVCGRRCLEGYNGPGPQIITSRRLAHDGDPAASVRARDAVVNADQSGVTARETA